MFNQRMRLLKLSKRFIRRSVHARATGHSQGQIVDAISIRERPAEIEDRAIPGHWEGDLLAGSKNTHIATLVERHSRFVILVKVPSKDIPKNSTTLPANTNQFNPAPNQQPVPENKKPTGSSS